jgi:TRAP-type C4-dicarboxylate transport system substrate-binding protein
MTKTLLAALAATAVATTAASAETWDMPLAYPASNYHSETAAAFGQCVTTGTGGEIEIVTHPNGSLFGGADIKRAVQTGQAPIGERLLSAHANENALFAFDSVPFLATSFDDAAKLWDAAEPKLDALLESQNLKLLYSVPWPPQGLYFKKPVESVADMQGVKFRAYNSATSRLAELTGMLPVQIEAAELSQAFATGVAESMISSGATGYDSKVWDSLTNFYSVNAWMPRNTVFVNMDAWNGLSEATQNVITACAELAAFAGEKAAEQYTDYTVGQLAANGMTVAAPSETLATELREIGTTMTNEWLENTGEDGKAIVDAFQGN